VLVERVQTMRSTLSPTQHILVLIGCSDTGRRYAAANSVMKSARC